MKRKTDDTIILQMLKEGKQQKEIAEYFGVSPAAVCKRIKRLLPSSEPKSLARLSEKEQKFVIAIAEGRTQTDAAMESFDVTTRDSAKSIGSRLMKQNDIQTAVSEIMQEQGLTRRYRIGKLHKHIDNPDPNVSLKGLDQSWKLDGAYQEKVVVEKGKSYSEMVKDMDEITIEIIRLYRELGRHKQADLYEQILKLDQNIIDVEP